MTEEIDVVEKYDINDLDTEENRKEYESDDLKAYTQKGTRSKAYETWLKNIIVNRLEEAEDVKEVIDDRYIINEFFNPNGEAWIVVLKVEHELYFFNDGVNSIERFYELRKKYPNAILAKLSYTPPEKDGSGEFKVASVGWNEIAEGYENMITKLHGEKDEQ